MAISSLRSRRARRDSAGFTLLEVMCAIIVMNVLVMVTARQIMAHNALVQTLGVVR
jgi:prepilin-type N-terminal cleavage/methylation domain-containing protein